LPGDGRRLMQFVHVKDVVTAAIRSATEPGTAGHAFNVANPRPITQMEVVEALADVAGKRPDVVRLPRSVLLQAGGHPMGPKLYFAFYYDLPPITEIIAKAQRMLHLQPIDFKTGLKETYRWYLRHHQKNTSNYEFEDKLLRIAATLPPVQPEI
jgi:nucleoside-diphosphate-sugar epimerase